MAASPVTVTGTVEITNWVTGAVQFVPAAADTSVAGDYIMNWVVTLRDTTTMKFPTDGFLWARINPSAATAPQLIVPLPLVKEHLNIRGAERTRDERLMRLIGAITPLIEERIGPVVPRNFEEWHDGGNDMIELLRRPSSGFGSFPLLNLVAVSEFRGPVEYPLAVIQNPVFGSIYSVFLDPDAGTITRRSAGGAVTAFFPGRQSVHVIYTAGQKQTPPNVIEAALECVRIAHQWTQPVGRGRMTQSDEQEVAGTSLNYELSRVIRAMLSPLRRGPSFA
jgi:hypothetical protein